MVDPTRYENMRAIHDRATRLDPDLGVVITSVDLSADAATVLPVEAALGYHIAQHLFLGSGPHLAVEGSSDFVYLMRMSEHLAAQARTGLDPKLSIVPVGGIGNMPAFVAILGGRLDVRVLIDGAQTAATAVKVRKAAAAVNVDDEHVVVLGETDGLPQTADIEDLFTAKDYLTVLFWEGHWWVADLDLARSAEAATGTNTRKGYGTSPHMTPETSKFERATIAADVYSLGVICYELLTQSAQAA